jgi:DNA-binding Lrp family transcriptional regulator
MPRDKVIDLLYELMRNSKRSDRELAEVLGVSQPTVTRMRKSLETLNYVKEYTVIPDFEKLGFEIVALSFVSASFVQDQLDRWLKENQKVVFSGVGEGLDGKSVLLVSVHRDFTDFSAFSSDVREFFGAKLAWMKSYLVSIKSGVAKDFSLKDLVRV